MPVHPTDPPDRPDLLPRDPAAVDDEPALVDRADVAGRSIGTFLGSAVDGFRGKAGIGGMLFVASLFGAGGGLAGSMAFDDEQAATPAQIEVLTKSVQDLTTRVYLLDARLTAHIEAGAHPAEVATLEAMSENLKALAGTVNAMQREFAAGTP